MRVALSLLVNMIVFFAVLASGCGDDAKPAAPPCDQACRDAVALRAVREMSKLVFNLTIQGKPVGPQDFTVPCPLGGSARVFGVATANATQGTVEVDLTYLFDACHYRERDDDAAENYEITLTAQLEQAGTFASQSTATTAVVMASKAVTIEGTVSSPPVAYEARACPLVLAQNGNDVTGLICEREAGFQF